jgi:DNA-binding transcriptional LysR family regulator
MNYTLHQLKVFATVVRLKSITKASEELHMSQPAVSIQLRNLQDQFDIPLTEVTGRNLRITDFGYELARRAEDMLHTSESIHQLQSVRKGLLTGRIRFSVVSTGKYIMPYFLAGYREMHPQVDLHMEVSNRASALEELKQGICDFALVSVLPQGMDLSEFEMLPNEIYLVGGPHYDKNIDHHVDGFELMRTQPFLLREEGSGTRLMMEKYLKKHRIKANALLELSSTEAIKHAVIAGLGLSMLSIYSIRLEIKNKDVQIIPVEGFPLRSTWRLVWLRKKRFTPAAEAYLNYLKENREGIIKSYFNWIDPAEK